MKRPKISDTEKQIVNEKIKGKTDAEIGEVIYPEAKPASARTLVNRHLNKPNVEKYLEQTLLQALKSRNVNWDMLVDKLVDKFNNGETDNVQLKATDKLIELLRSKDIQTYDQLPTQQQIPNNMNLVEAQRYLFESKSSE